MALETRYYDPITALNLARIAPGTVEQVHLAAIYAVIVGSLPGGQSGDRWLQFFDQDTAPTGGEFPRLRFTQPRQGEADLNLIFQQPIQFVGGIWWASSKTAINYTPVDPGELIVIMQGQYY